MVCVLWVSCGSATDLEARAIEADAGHGQHGRDVDVRREVRHAFARRAFVEDAGCARRSRSRLRRSHVRDAFPGRGRLGHGDGDLVDARDARGLERVESADTARGHVEQCRRARRRCARVSRAARRRRARRRTARSASRPQPAASGPKVAHRLVRRGLDHDLGPACQQRVDAHDEGHIELRGERLAARCVAAPDDRPPPAPHPARRPGSVRGTGARSCHRR